MPVANVDSARTATSVIMTSLRTRISPPCSLRHQPSHGVTVGDHGPSGWFPSHPAGSPATTPGPAAAGAPARLAARARPSARLARTPPSPHTLKLLVAPVIFLVICSNVANVMWPTLAGGPPAAAHRAEQHQPLPDPGRPTTSTPVSYYGVGTLRLLVSDPLFFLLGYWYGDRALEWMDRRRPTYGPMLRGSRACSARRRGRWSSIMPNNFICLFAGAAGMRDQPCSSPSTSPARSPGCT